MTRGRRVFLVCRRLPELLLAFALLTAACGSDSGSQAADLGCLAIDADEDGWPACMDCDDGDPAVFPGADEIVGDGVDQDCSGSDATGGIGGGAGGAGGSPSGGPWVDADDDGWPAFADCDDDDPAVFPGAEEIPYDGIDQNCSGGDSDDLDKDGFRGGPGGDDCDDARADMHPGAIEVPLDGIDQNCDGSDLAGTDDFTAVPPATAVPGAGLALAAGTTSAGGPVVLAAWPDSREAPRQDIYARFVSASGSPVGEEFPIVVGGVAKSNVRIASKGDGYLVAWDDLSGVWAQRVTRDGALEGAALGIGSPGTSDPHPAWGGANWALIWKSPIEGLESRGVSTEGVRGDKQVVTGTPGTTISLAGGALGFLAVWDGPQLLGRRLDAVGAPVGDPFPVSSEGNVAAPRVGCDGSRYLVAFRRGAGTVSARAQFVGLDGTVASPATSVRLSVDSVSVTDLRVVPTNSGFFAAWNDGRHLSHVPSYGGVYGNLVRDEDDQVSWPGGAALHVDTTAALSDAVFVGTNVLAATRVGSVYGVVRWARSSL
jgi:hypothetical protein